ncbi:MAG: sensor protein FixL [Lysobacteraceae bacterium]|nr:MAG: sensor protein FixL [Xanthomonadaceae bacterium]
MKRAKSSEQAAQQPSTSERFIRTLLDNLPGMAYRCANDRPWTMQFVSDGCEVLTGHEAEYVAGGEFLWTSLIHADDLTAARAAVNKAIAIGGKFDIQYRIVDKSGQEKWVREQGCGVSDEHGNIVAIEGYIDDVTPIKEAARALAQSEKFYQEEIRQRHEKLNVTIDNAPIGIVTYRCGGTFERVNHAFCEMTGYSAVELQEMVLEDLTDPIHLNETTEFLGRVQRGEIDTYSQNSRYICKDGTKIDVRVINAATHDATGRPNVIISQVTDISSQIKAQSEIRRQHELLAHADRLHTLGEMATGIAHEINQPLTAISLFAHTGKRRYEAGEFDRLPEIFEKLGQHSKRAGAIVERIQHMGRRTESARVLAQLNEVIKDVVILAEVDARSSEIEIQLNLAEYLPEIRVNIVQIHQVALNLLRNGMDAMRALGCRNGNIIEVCTRQLADGYLEVAVSDSGCGISNQLAEHLFDSFLTTKSSGLGMGLPISRAIISAHGGQLLFRNNPTCGATFTFTLPVVLSENPR